MPVQTSPPIPASFPSFMSVFGGDHRMEDLPIERKSLDTHPESTFNSVAHQSPSKYPINSVYHHRGSVTTVGTESTESSPTTTISTFDSISVTASTDPSPSSSPESPTSLAPISHFKAMVMRPVTAGSDYISREGAVKPQGSTSNTGHPESPSSRARNVKNLSLNVPPNCITGTTSSNNPDSSRPLSAPSSPLKPPFRVNRRKPTNLTIQTPGFEKLSFAAAGHVPPTPSGRPTLRHFESSPALPSLFSPTSQPPGGMQFPKPAFGRLTSNSGSERSSFSNQSSIGHSIAEIPEGQDEALKSQETPERGYTNGPVRIYDSGLWLYLEPTEEEASKFDVVINVAKEVKNPFAADNAKSRPSVMSVWRKDETLKRFSISEPQTAMSEKSFQSAFEWPVFDGSAISKPAMKTGPEYIHVPWDHNSEILEDLEPLCQLIDSRIKAGKTVLVHCQLGVSRSASLVIAYGLFKKYQPDFHSMYTAVKERSRWVGPNMSLIYQLMDFRSRVAKQSPEDPPAESTVGFKPVEVKKTPMVVLPDPISPPAPTSRMVSTSTQTDFEPFYSIRPPPNYQTPMNTSPQSVRTLPSHLPSDFQSISPPRIPGLNIAKRAAPRPLPFREKPLPAPPSEVTIHSRPATRIPSGHDSIQAKTIQFDHIMQDVPQTPSLMSPRVTEFLASSFPRTIAGDLAITSRTERTPSIHIPGSWPKFLEQDPKLLEERTISTRTYDPRSPPQPLQVHEIMPNIDDVL